MRIAHEKAYVETPPSLDKVVFCPFKGLITRPLLVTHGVKRERFASQKVYDSILPKLTKI